jgi:hypothetical protein
MRYLAVLGMCLGALTFLVGEIMNNVNLNSTFIQETAQTLGTLVSQKNEAYGDAFAQAGDVIRVLYPDGVRPEQYIDLLVTVRIVDKLFRIANRKDAFGESPWQDIAGYGILMTAYDNVNIKAST